MVQLQISVTSGTQSSDFETLAEMRDELNRFVGSADLVEEAASPGTKGLTLLGVLTVALTSKGLMALVDVLKAYIARDQKIIFKFKGASGEATLEAARPGADKELISILRQVLGPLPTEKSGA